MGQEYDGLHSFAYYSEPPRNGNSGTPTPPHAPPELALGWASLSKERKEETNKDREKEGKEKEDRKTGRRKDGRKERERKKEGKKALGSEALLPSFPCFVGFSRFCALPPLASERARICGSDVRRGVREEEDDGARRRVCVTTPWRIYIFIYM